MGNSGPSRPLLLVPAAGALLFLIASLAVSAWTGDWTALALIAVVVLGAGSLLAAVTLRRRSIRTAVERADFDRLAARFPSAAPAPESAGPLLDYLRQAPHSELVALGDRALESRHPFAATIFDEVHSILTAREEARRAAAERRASWPALRTSPDDEPSVAP